MISQIKCAKCCGRGTRGTPAWLPRQVLYINTGFAAEHFCKPTYRQRRWSCWVIDAERAVGLYSLASVFWHLPEPAVRQQPQGLSSPGLSVHLMLSKQKELGGVFSFPFFFSPFVPEDLSSPDMYSLAEGHRGIDLFSSASLKVSSSRKGRCFTISRGRAASCSFVY